MSRKGASLGNSTCSGFMRTMCSLAKATPRQAWLMQGPSGMGRQARVSCNHANQTVAVFLIARPSIAFIGNGWESDDVLWNDVWLLQPGQSTGTCEETTPGVFSREWSQGAASLPVAPNTNECPSSRSGTTNKSCER